VCLSWGWGGLFWGGLGVQKLDHLLHLICFISSASSYLLHLICFILSASSYVFTRAPAILPVVRGGEVCVWTSVRVLRGGRAQKLDHLIDLVFALAPRHLCLRGGRVGCLCLQGATNTKKALECFPGPLYVTSSVCHVLCMSCPRAL